MKNKKKIDTGLDNFIDPVESEIRDVKRALSHVQDLIKVKLSLIAMLNAHPEPSPDR